MAMYVVDMRTADSNKGLPSSPGRNKLSTGGFLCATGNSGGVAFPCLKHRIPIERGLIGGARYDDEESGVGSLTARPDVTGPCASL
jgi:hypothetical protein